MINDNTLVLTEVSVSVLQYFLHACKKHLQDPDTVDNAAFDKAVEECETPDLFTCNREGAVEAWKKALDTIVAGYLECAPVRRLARCYFQLGSDYAEMFDSELNRIMRMCVCNDRAFETLMTDTHILPQKADRDVVANMFMHVCWDSMALHMYDRANGYSAENVVHITGYNKRLLAEQAVFQTVSGAIAAMRRVFAGGMDLLANKAGYDYILWQEIALQQLDAMQAGTLAADNSYRNLHDIADLIAVGNSDDNKEAVRRYYMHLNAARRLMQEFMDVFGIDAGTECTWLFHPKKEDGNG